eukprot:CAMPEP_0113888452 /NCGR_PEP_ID=MMETSP0780_2-20120614/12870_1 /TAXON_ID=652834 /ORGANISM="Palpitomonas bilix" /LENGTH=606 /DNA_ID=CAMNT_0000877283 /DNA_START=23 /DNA_END=1843 /DNA_ORIENTATION=+ /assembly_acc=CAM_ASM_000599
MGSEQGSTKEKNTCLAIGVLFLLAALAGLAVSMSIALSTSDGGGSEEGKPAMIRSNAEDWWKTAVVYQIYPRSFKDSDGDGTGDLRGIIEKLPYLQHIGINAVWLSPIFDSPMADFGYDVKNYKKIWEVFGSMSDFEEMISEMHKRGIRLFLDFVPNHTSEETSWFAESRSSLTNAKRDWYRWMPPAEGGGPPNNWLSFFGGSAWQYDNQTGEYYLHQFLKEQPDLNYHNDEVKEAMLGVLDFWYAKGVDGFRVDALHTVYENPTLADEPSNPTFNQSTDNPFDSLLHIYTQNFPPLHSLVKAMREVSNKYTPTRALICEVYAVLPQLLKYYGGNLDECHLPFNFKLLEATMSTFTVSSVKASISEYLSSIPDGGVPNWVLGNHDNHRVGSRIGAEYVRVMNMLLLSLPGSATTYYGEEIGMLDVPIPYEQTKDPFAQHMTPDIAEKVGRDPERTPMQWTDDVYAGFKPDNGIESWLPVGDNLNTTNVETQLLSPTSVLSAYKAMIELRQRPCFQSGHFTWLDGSGGGEEVMVFTRWVKAEGEMCIVVLNFGKEQVSVDYSSVTPFPARIIGSTAGETEAVELDSLQVVAPPLSGLVLLTHYSTEL